jgi:hypothetical protein
MGAEEVNKKSSPHGNRFLPEIRHRWRSGGVWNGFVDHSLAEQKTDENYFLNHIDIPV